VPRPWKGGREVKERRADRCTFRVTVGRGVALRQSIQLRETAGRRGTGERERQTKRIVCEIPLFQPRPPSLDSLAIPSSFESRVFLRKEHPSSRFMPKERRERRRKGFAITLT